MAIGGVLNPKNFSINFTEYTLPVNKDEQIKWENHQLTTGQKSPIELMMCNDPDLTLEVATKKYEENLEMMKQNTDASSSEVASTNPFDKI
jgi:hypothetical protein